MADIKYFLSKERNKTNHLNYYYFTKAFTPAEIIKIREYGDSLQKQTAVTGGEDGVISDYRKSDIAWIPQNKETMWFDEKISE